MTDSTSRRQALETFSQLISDMPVAMLTTCLADHSLRSRPMFNINSKFDGDLWFFAHDDDPKVQEIQGNPQVNLSFAEPSERRYVSVSGSADVVRDQKHAECLWTEECERWFPEGLDDPKLVLLKVDVHRAEYWDETARAMQAISGLFKSSQDAVKHEKLDWEEKAPTPGVPE